MPSLSLTIDHALSREEALERLQRLIEFAKAAYGQHVNNLEETWHEEGVDFAFSAMGFKTQGRMVVAASQVIIDSKLPLAALMLRGKIEETLRKQVGRALS